MARSTRLCCRSDPRDVLRASFLYLARRRGLQRFVTRGRITSSLAYRFVAGDRLDDAVRVVAEVNRRGWSASLDHLGENVTEEKAARSAADDYLAAFERIATDGLNANVSVKLTQLGLDISSDLCRELLTRIVQRAQQLDNFVRVDMEGSAYTQRTPPMTTVSSTRPNDSLAPTTSRPIASSSRCCTASGAICRTGCCAKAIGSGFTCPTARSGIRT